MVVQASAGQRMAPADRDGVAGALESVAEAAAQAQTEVGRLVELLSGDPPAGPPPGLAMVDELVRRASGSGLAVSCRFAGSCDRLAPAASEAAYRVVQEALTNALKHAPGAPVDITVRSQGAEVAVDVVNAPGRQRPSGLERSGAGFGLAGMRDRVAACGGSLTCGPTAGRRLAGVGAAAHGARRGVTRGWRPDEFWRVGPGKTGRVGQNETRPPPRMRWRGPCSGRAAPGRPVARLTLHCGPPAGASHPPKTPVSRLLPRPGVSSEWCPFPAVKYFLRLLRAPRKRSGPFIFVLFLIHTMSTECTRLSARTWGYPPAYAQLVHR